MSNFKYFIADKVYVLSPDEHGQILELIKKGKSGLTILRLGSLVINLAFIRSVNETDDLTVEEEKQRDRQLQLTPESGKTADERYERARTYLSENREEFYRKMGWL